MCFTFASWAVASVFLIAFTARLLTQATTMQPGPFQLKATRPS